MKKPKKLVWVGIGVCVVGLIIASAVFLPGFLQKNVKFLAQRIAPGASQDIRAFSKARTPEGVSVEIAKQETVSPSQLGGSLRLVGTWVSDDPRWSMALLEDVKREKSAFVRVGDQVGPWQVTTIERGWAMLTTPQGNEKRLEMEAAGKKAGLADQPAPLIYSGLNLIRSKMSSPTQETLAKVSEAITVISEEERVIDREQVMEAMQGNPLPILSQSRMMPYIEGLRLVGFRVASLADSPWAEKVGLRVGDVVMAVNGKSVLDPSKAVEIGSDLISASNVDLTIKRSGEEVTLRYYMVDASAER